MGAPSWKNRLFAFAGAALAVGALTLAVPPAASAGSWTWPVRGPVITPYVNDNERPYAGGMHRGIDIGAPVGADVVAAQSGHVTYAGSLGSSGLTVAVETSDGRYATSYLHLSRITVSRAQSLATGEKLGEVGTTGTRSASQPHLHFGVRLADQEHFYIDPLTLLPPIAGGDAPRSPSPQPAPLRSQAAPVPLGPVPVAIPGSRAAPTAGSVPGAHALPARTPVPGALPGLVGALPDRSQALAGAPLGVRSPEPGAQAPGGVLPTRRLGGAAAAGHAHSPGHADYPSRPALVPAGPDLRRTGTAAAASRPGRVTAGVPPRATNRGTLLLVSGVAILAFAAAFRPLRRFAPHAAYAAVVGASVARGSVRSALRRLGPRSAAARGSERPQPRQRASEPAPPPVLGHVSQMG